MHPRAAGSMVVEAGTPSSTTENHSFVVGRSPSMRAIERVASEIAATDIPVLIVGDSCTGKEVVAMRIHQLSERRDQGMLTINCAALTLASLQEHLDGAKNGEAQGAVGRGTLFLDEISELDLACQPRLLHALPDGNGPRHGPSLGARLICSTSRNLEEEMRAGRFREELYFRINGVCLRLPPLRHRKEDIRPLVEHFLDKQAGLLGRPRPALSAGTLGLLQDYSWPGNVRELENVVK
ncbi:MAG: sigma 54-interacting transcriptional regulator, partial [Burkholderiales bacterium]